jgi:hypothetical protein
MFLRFFDSPFIYHKNEKSKPQKKDLPSFKNDITRMLRSKNLSFIAVTAGLTNCYVRWRNYKLIMFKDTDVTGLRLKSSTYFSCFIILI